MKVELVKGFDPFRIIKAALKNGGRYADLYLEETRNNSIVLEEDKIEKVVSGRDRGCGIRVISDRLKTFYAYTNDLTEKGLLDLAGVVAGAVKEGGTAGDISLVKKEIAPGFEIKVPPGGVGLEEKIALVNKGNSVARDFDKRVRQVKVVYGDGFRSSATINSLGQWVEEERTSILYLCQVVSGDGGVIQTGYEPIGGVMGFEIFDENPPELIAETAARRAVMMLGAERAPAGRMPVVLSSEAGGTMIHEAVGHGLEADLAQEGLSVYSGKIGQEVASPLITVIDDGTMPNKRGSSFFDDEGSPTQRTVLVENGVLKRYMSDRLNAMKAEEGGEGGEA
ncbi:MAG: TldD/PmbA family protein, partial [Thermodesulfobacteriota bacterium]